MDKHEYIIIYKKNKKIIFVCKGANYFSNQAIKQ